VVTKKTREEDDRLRKELQNADMGKFEKAIKAALRHSPKKKSKRKNA